MTTENTQLVILDIQGKLSQIVSESAEVLRNSRILIEGGKLLDLPIVWVEQMPDKLGSTNPVIAELLEGYTPVKKSSFSAWGNAEFREELKANKRKHVLLIGIETHICIYQTAVDLLAEGYEVSVIADAVSSRTESNKRIGLTMLRDAGAKVLSTEAVLFALLRTAEHPRFKEIARLVK
ncbi:hydrolase [Capnocytophaga sp. HP1101]